MGILPLGLMFTGLNVSSCGLACPGILSWLVRWSVRVGVSVKVTLLLAGCFLKACLQVATQSFFRIVTIASHV
jgi:hypothetical protein